MVLQYHPLKGINDISLGFDKVFDTIEKFVERTPNVIEKYPPHNLIKTDNGYTIEIAMAGFQENEIDISLVDNILRVSGEIQQTSENSGHSFVHRGISSRKFTKNFVVAENIKVDDATFVNGLLKINLSETKAEVRKIQINNKPELLNE